MSAHYSNFIAAHSANHTGTQVSFSRALSAAGVHYDAVHWLGDIQVYTWLGAPTAWWHSNKGYSAAIGLMMAA